MGLRAPRGQALVNQATPAPAVLSAGRRSLLQSNSSSQGGFG